MEWVGGFITPPFFLMDRDEPYRPMLALWMELPNRLVVGQDLQEPEACAGAVGRALRTALEHPMVGSSRRPTRIRVADASLAEEVRQVVGEGIPIRVAPTPELDEVLQAMVAAMPEEEDEASYLDDGRVSPKAVGELFSAAAVLFALKPWEVADDGRVLRMDIPALGIEGACISIIGALGESLGVLIFPSLAGYEAFLRVAEALGPEGGPRDLGSGWLSLGFERGADLPTRMRREIAKYGWPVESPDAYPRVDRRDRDGTPRPLVERDFQITKACATSLSTFFALHRDLFERDEFEPVCESYLDDEDLEVRLTLPYEMSPLFEADPNPTQTATAASLQRHSKVGRNDPCPCGSGRKYKKCHLPLEEAEPAAAHGKSRLHDLDAQMVAVLSRFAETRFGEEWRSFENDFDDVEAALQLAVPWSVYAFHVAGGTVFEAYLESRGKRGSAIERGWLAAQQAAWLSVWEVTQVEPGERLQLRDLLSGEMRSVHEVSGSQSLVARDALLARVVGYEGASILCGTHPRVLPPFHAAEVVRRARGRLRRRRAVPLERLRDEAFGRYLIRRWEDAAEDLDASRAIPPELQNTDGDPLILTTDHFEIAPGARSAVEAQLAALEGAVPPADDEDPGVYAFLRPGNALHASWDNTLIGRARFSETTLELETNSRKRADALREQIETACGDRICYRVREHTDPLSSKASPAAADPSPGLPPPEMQQALLAFKQREYADWPDQPLPGLGGTTPREAARAARGRAAVDVLLKTMENHEQRSAGAAAFDFSELRRELGLE